MTPQNDRDSTEVSTQLPAEVTPEELYERIEDGFLALDNDWRLTYLNQTAAELLDVDRTDVIGKVVWEEFEAAVESTFQREYERAMESQKPVSFVEYYPPLDAWFEVSAYPGTEGLSVYFRDVSERIERERDLERYETIVETVEDGIYVVDENGTFQMVNRAYAELLGYPREELIGADVSLVVSQATAEQAQELQSELLDGTRSQASLEAELVRADGETIHAEATFSMLPDGQRVGVVRDLSERRQREAELERLHDLLERSEQIAGVGGWEVNVDTDEVFWTGHLFELLGRDPDEEEPPLEDALDVYVEEDRPKVADALETAIEQQTEFDIDARLRRPDGALRWVRIKGKPITEDGEVVTVRGVVNDITERKRFENRLVELHQVGRELLRARTTRDIISSAVQALHDILEAPAAGFYQYDSEAAELHPAQISDGGFVDVELSTVEPGPGSLIGQVFESNEARYVERISEADEVQLSEAELGLRSAVLAPVPGFGVLIAASPEPDGFDEERRQLVEIVATSAGAGFSQVKHEDLLRSQRDRLAALNDINSIIHGLSASMFGLSDRAEIEDQVCRRLAETDSFEFAWIGTVEDGEIVVSTEAGVENNGASVTLTADGPSSDGPSATAHRTGEMEVVQNVDSAERYQRVVEHAREHGYRASASIPIRNGDREYGTLNVYSARSNAFDEEERDSLERLGSIIAYAISSVARDRQLQYERNRIEFMNRLLRHNLLNSLNVVQSRLEFLDGWVDYERASHLDTAIERTDDMIRFVQTIRDVAKAIAQGEERELQAVDVGVVIESCVERVRSNYPAAEFRIDSLPSASVEADELLDEAIENVLNNAAQHNPKDEPTVWVDADTTEDVVSIAIRDDGPGLSEEEKLRIFDTETGKLHAPESGFGLYLVHELIQSYGGEITVEDNDPRGTVFTIVLPRAEPPT